MEKRLDTAQFPTQRKLFQTKLLTPVKFTGVTLHGLINYSIFLIKKIVKYGFKCVACREITGP